MDLLPRFDFYLLLFLLFSFSSSSLSSPPSTTQTFCHDDEATALLQFKHSFSTSSSLSGYCASYSPDGYHYYLVKSNPKTRTWKEGTNCCQWEGVSCDNGTGHVVRLELSCSQLYGSFPLNSSLFTLQNLQTLNLAFNDFNGSTIPLEFSRLTSLKHLNLSNSSFYGDIPSQMSRLSNLLSLDLSLNDQLTMERDTFSALVQNLSMIRELFLDLINMSSIEVGLMANLSSSLTSLSASWCSLRGWLPESVFRQPQLKYIDLDLNIQLTGELPDLIGKLKSLYHLDLSFCNFSGPIPKSLGNLSQLVYLDFGENNFFGDQLLHSVTNLTQLEQLSLRSCSLRGRLPENVFNLPQLKYFDLGLNFELTGELPDSIGKSKSLNHLDLSFCNFSGPLPRSLGNLSQLVYLDFAGNNFLGGQLLPSLTNLTQLERLSLPLCQLSGSIPDEAKFLNLRFLDLSLNNLIGKIPSWLFKLPQLSSLELSDNQFTGHIRNFHSTKLELIDLARNKLQGSIPSSIYEQDHLISLDLSSNNLSGTVDLGVLSKLQSLRPLALRSLSVSKNNLFGEISSSICSLTSLEILDMSHNKFSGSIPDCLVNSSHKLSVLNFGSNSFSGTIPATFSKGCQLENLSLNENLLEGTLPASISFCKGLKVLDLGTNQFSDTFPSWVEALPELEVLILRSNKFYGFLRTSSRYKHPFHKLQILDLSNNQLFGPIAKWHMKNLKSMVTLDESQNSLQYIHNTGDSTYDYSVSLIIKGSEIEFEKILTVFASIDLSGNLFSGKISEDIGMLGALKGLNLSHNKLSAQIPTSIRNLKNLEWLDLSSNKLTGQIPEELAELTFLSTLNLSNNQLTGPIPQGKQFNTFSNDSYIGNEGLCGLPLSKQCSNSKGKTPPAVVLQQDDDLEHQSAIEWKAVLMGCGCGVNLGISVAYFIFYNGDPTWFLKLVRLIGIERRVDHRAIRRI